MRSRSRHAGELPEPRPPAHLPGCPVAAATPRVAKVTVSDLCAWLRFVVTIVEFCQQSRGALLRMRGRLIFTPPEEVSMSPSCFIKGLLIAENAG